MEANWTSRVGVPAPPRVQAYAMGVQLATFIPPPRPARASQPDVDLIGMPIRGAARSVPLVCPNGTSARVSSESVAGAYQLNHAAITRGLTNNVVPFPCAIMANCTFPCYPVDRPTAHGLRAFIAPLPHCLHCPIAASVKSIPLLLAVQRAQPDAEHLRRLLFVVAHPT